MKADHLAFNLKSLHYSFLVDIVGVCDVLMCVALYFVLHILFVFCFVRFVIVLLCFYCDLMKGLQMKISYKLTLVQYIKW